jgi:hypothetical protein
MSDQAGILQTILEGIGGKGSFLVSFVFGAIVIAFFSRKKLEDFVSPPKGEEYDFVRMLTVTSVVGGEVFRTAYLYYLVLLEFFYAFLCISKPVVFGLASAPEGGAFEGASWPLGAALLVVGFLPSSPILAQVELAIRNAAYNAANIPGVFFERVTRLSQSDVEELVSVAPAYRPDLERFYDLNTMLACLNIPPDDALSIARKTVGADLFAQWTLKGSNIWSAEEYDKYKDVLDLLKPKYEALHKDIQDLARRTRSSPVVIAILSGAGVSLNGTKFDQEAASVIRQRADQMAAGHAGAGQATPGQEDIDHWHRLRELWLEKEGELSIAIRRLSALFSILARNDRHIRKLYGGKATDENALGLVKLDPVLKRLLDLLEDRIGPNLWYNTSLVSNIAAFAGCFTLLSIYLYFVDPLLFGPPPDGSVETTIKTSLMTSANLFLSFVIASLTALSLRALRKKNDTWIMFRDLATFPFVQYLPIALVSALAAFMPQIVLYILYYYQDTATNDVLQQSQDILADTMVFKILWTLVPVSFAIGLCVLCDIVERNREAAMRTPLPIAMSVIVGFIAFILLSMNNEIYPISGGAFWHNIVSSWLFAAGGLLVFQASATAART